LALAVQDGREGANFAVRVSPRASRTAITGVMGEGADAVVKIALAAPPVDGRANEELVAFLAGVLGVSRSDVVVTAGLQSRNKRVRVRGRSADEVRGALEGLIS
jgi:uncharacterized protein (TIGR00251 family)